LGPIEKEGRRAGRGKEMRLKRRVCARSEVVVPSRGSEGVLVY
jgi:hypothetical protein